MSNLKATPQAIYYFIVGLIFVPRFFSDVAYQTGTVLILIFWIVPFVLIAEIANENWNEKVRFSELPKITLAILVLCFIIISASFYWRELIYADSINSYQNIKRSLYLLNPLILISWCPFIKSIQKREFLLIFSVLTLALFCCLSAPKVFEILFIESFLNDLTASISGHLLDSVSEFKVRVNKNILYLNKTSIKIGGGCSSTPQILISFFASLAFYICCKIKSKKYIVFYVIISTIIVFTFNAIRISLLGYLVSIDKMEKFDFWHDGAGSLIFSFFVMLFTCSIYYYLWAKENPIYKETMPNNEGPQKN